MIVLIRNNETRRYTAFNPATQVTVAIVASTAYALQKLDVEVIQAKDADEVKKIRKTYETYNKGQL